MRVQVGQSPENVQIFIVRFFLFFFFLGAFHHKSSFVCVVRFFSFSRWISFEEIFFNLSSPSLHPHAFGFYRFFPFPWSPPCIKMREKKKKSFLTCSYIFFFSRLKNKMNIKEKVEWFTKKKCVVISRYKIISIS